MNEQITAALATFGIQFSIEPNSTPPTIRIESNDLLKFSQHLQTNDQLYFDQLSCVTGIDNGPDVKTVEVLYHFYSIPFHHSLGVKVILPHENPEVESLSSLWKSANWMEREVYDMFGIKFLNHPDLRRILMPNDWDGFPLRKDYEEQENYRDIKLS